jgi:hypothetical protein
LAFESIVGFVFVAWFVLAQTLAFEVPLSVSIPIPVEVEGAPDGLAASLTRYPWVPVLGLE